MSWFNSLHDLTGDIGSLAKKAAPVAAFIPGVGPLAAAGIGAAGGLLSHEGVGGALEGAAGGYGGGLLHGATGGAQSLESILSGSGAIPEEAFGDAANGGGGVSGLIHKAGDFLTGNGGKNALGVAQGVSSILDQQKANNYAKDALGSVEGSYAQRAPLRAQGVQQILASQQGNPYAGGR